MSEDPEPDRLLHRRTIAFEAFDEGDEVLVIGRLRDQRPWAADVDGGAEEVHDMELRVRVRLSDLTISVCEADMHTFPHTECPAIAPAFRGLVGLRVTRGFTRAVQSLVAGPNGCTHLDQLARGIGPVVVQTITSRRARAMREGQADELLTDRSNAPWAGDSCHVWAAGGVAEQKLAAGWRPGRGPYPAPALEDVLSSSDGDGPSSESRQRGPG